MRYCSSLTFSIQFTAVPSSFSWTAMCVMAFVAQLFGQPLLNRLQVRFALLFVSKLLPHLLKGLCMLVGQLGIRECLCPLCDLLA